MTIKLRYCQLGQHMHVEVFMGKHVGALALVGTLVMSPEELRSLGRALEYGAVGTAEIDVVWEEPVLCEACATAIGMTAHRHWHVEEEDE